MEKVCWLHGDSTPRTTFHPGAECVLLGGRASLVGAMALMAFVIKLHKLEKDFLYKNSERKYTDKY